MKTNATLRYTCYAAIVKLQALRSVKFMRSYLFTFRFRISSVISIEQHIQQNVIYTQN